MKRVLAGLLASVMVLGTMAGCSSGGGSSSSAASTAGGDKPYDGTTLKVLLAYGGAEKSFDAFTEKTGIKIEYVEMSTGQALAKMEAANGEAEADVWFGGGVDSYIAATEKGYLEAYTSPEAGAIDAAYKDKDGYWTTLALVPAGFQVNNDVLKEKGLEAPKTWEDLCDPKYKGEIIMANPAISGTQYAIVNGLIQAWGEEKAWQNFEKIYANLGLEAEGGGEPGKKVIAGEYGIAVLAITGGTFESEKQYPVTTIYPEDMIPWTPAPIAIFKNSTQKDAAKVFVDYMLSKEGQEALKEADARIMARNDVEVPAEIGTVDTSKLIKQDVSLFGSQRDDILAKWKAEFQD